MLSAESCLGTIKPNSLPNPSSAGPEVPDQVQEKPTSQFPPLSSIVNVSDFEKVAEKYLSPSGWAYYSSGAEDEISLSDTRRIFNRIAFRPRILRNVDAVSTTTSILGHHSTLPIYISPTGLGRYAHRDAEKVLASVAGQEGIIYMMPTAPSQPHEAIFAARTRADQPLFFQLYLNRDHARAEALVRRAEALGAAAIFLTVDSPVIGRRERDERVKAAAGERTTPTSTNNNNTTTTAGAGAGAGVARVASSGLLNPGLVWDDLAWLRTVTRLPVVVKGVQSVEDAVLAHDRGAAGVVLSNHGGRSLDTAQAPLLTLLELRRHVPHLLAAPVRDRFQVFVDGGVRRGTDVLKALALGASAVGVGRPFLYSMTAGYGEDGVRHLVGMLRAEIETGMALLGATNVAELVPEMVNSERAEVEVSRRIKL